MPAGAPSDWQCPLAPGVSLHGGALPAPAGPEIRLHFEPGERPAGGCMRVCAPGPGGAAVAVAAPDKVSLRLSRAAAEELVTGHVSAAAHRLRELLASAAGGEFALPLTPGAALALESLRRCPFAGAWRTIAFTARGHDLLLEFLTALANVSAPPGAPLLRGFVDRINAAAAILRREIEAPPALPELARRAGLSETTLKRGFRQVYGTTVFGYLRRRRMEQARALIAAGEVTVLEAATRVGYSNPSNFAAAFRREFGVNPKEFQMAVRGR